MRGRLEDDDLDDDEAGSILAELMLPPVIPEREPLDPGDYVRRLLRGAVALLVALGLGRGGNLKQLVAWSGREGDFPGYLDAGRCRQGRSAGTCGGRFVDGLPIRGRF